MAAAAKLCYSPAGATELMRDLEPEKVQHFVQLLTKMGHESPIEHISFTFSVEGVSRSLTHQLVRHRIASYSQKSQRYVREGGFSYVIPPAIEESPQTKELFIQAMEEQQKAYDKLADYLADQYEQKYISEGMTGKKSAFKCRKKMQLKMPGMSFQMPVRRK